LEIFSVIIGCFTSDNKTLNANGGNTSSDTLKMPSFSQGTEVYDSSGNKFELYVTYNLYNKADSTNKETWQSVAYIKDKKTDQNLSNNYTFGKLVFNSPDSQPTFSGNSTVTSKNGLSIQLNLLGVPDGDKTTNGGYVASSVRDSYQDGVGAGVLEDVRINEDGLIVLNFTNNKQEVFGRVGLVKFPNDQGLRKIGNNLFEQAPSLFNGAGSKPSGDIIMGWNENGKLTTSRIMQNKLEKSNTDLSESLTNLIIYQRAYAANSKSITTSDEMVQRAINLKN
jgi:flagellar hook protein FlgE